MKIRSLVFVVSASLAAVLHAETELSVQDMDAITAGAATATATATALGNNTTTSTGTIASVKPASITIADLGVTLPSIGNSGSRPALDVSAWFADIFASIQR